MLQQKQSRNNEKKWTSLLGLSIHMRNCEGAKRPGKRSKTEDNAENVNHNAAIPSSNRRELVEVKNSYSMSVTYKQKKGKGQQVSARWIVLSQILRSFDLR